MCWKGSAVLPAVLQAMRMVGSSFGAAVLGSVLNAGYRSSLAESGTLERLPASVADTARDSVLAAVDIADRLGLAPLVQAARSAYVSGMDRMLWVAAALSVAGAVLAAAAMAGQGGRLEPEEAVFEHERDSVG